MHRITIILYLICTLTGFLNANSHDTFSRVVSREELAQAGVLRISDVLALVETWQVSSLSGYLHQTSVNSLSPYGQELLAVYLDGQEITPDLLNMVNLESIPLDVSAIDSIVFTSIPKRMKGGALTSGGSINIYSLKKVANIALKLGNETGEPGPYRYTDRLTPNIDTIGPLANFAVAIPISSFYINSYANGQIFMFTDQTVHRRNQDLLEGQPNVKRWLINSIRPEMVSAAVLLKTGYTGESFQVHALHHQSYADKLMTFFEPLSREIPFDVLRKQSAFSGVFGKIEKSRRILWSIHENDLAIKERYNRIGFQSDWHFVKTRAHLGVELNGNKASSTKTGLNFIQHQFGFLDSAEYEPKQTLTRSIYLNHRKVIFQNVPIMIDIELKLENNRYYPSVLIDLSRSLLEGRTKMALALSHTQAPSWEHNSLLDPNAGLLEIIEQNLEPDHYEYGYEATRKRSTADVFLEQQVNNRNHIKIGAHFRKDDGLSLNILDSVSFIQPGRGFNTYAFLGKTSHGSNASFDFAWSYSNQPTLTHYLFLSKRFDIHGDDEYHQIYRHVPTLKSEYRFNWSANPRMNVWIASHYESGSQWEEYRELEGVEWLNENQVQTHSPDVPASFTIDVTIRKKFLGENLDAALIIRNILDDEKLLHPIGGDEGRTFYLVLNIHPFWH
ncbi:MAG: hypothetical protein HOB84_15135 [Candidatus Marinimicrobia bacterium]|nr:hypothetical protein [Candidatus Neomarinimicrobiota bacterium]